MQFPLYQRSRNSQLSLKLDNVFFIAYPCIYILFSPERWKCYIKLNCFSHFFIHTLATYFFGQVRSKGELGSIESHWSPCLPLSSKHHFQPKWMAVTGKSHRKGLVDPLATVAVLEVRPALNPPKLSPCGCP